MSRLQESVVKLLVMTAKVSISVPGIAGEDSHLGLGPALVPFVEHFDDVVSNSPAMESLQMHIGFWQLEGIYHEVECLQDSIIVVRAKEEVVRDGFDRLVFNGITLKPISIAIFLNTSGNAKEIQVYLECLPDVKIVDAGEISPDSVQKDGRGLQKLDVLPVVDAALLHVNFGLRAFSENIILKARQR